MVDVVVVGSAVVPTVAGTVAGAAVPEGPVVTGPASAGGPAQAASASSPSTAIPRPWSAFTILSPTSVERSAR